MEHEEFLESEYPQEFIDGWCEFQKMTTKFITCAQDPEKVICCHPDCCSFTDTRENVESKLKSVKRRGEKLSYY